MSADANVTELGAQLRVAVMRLYLRQRREQPDGDLGDKALEVLTRIANRGGLTLTELSAEDGIAPASMSDSINRLVAEGLAIRTPDPADRRRMLLSATPSGAEAAAAARTVRHRWMDAQLASLSDGDRASIARACELFERMADS